MSSATANGVAAHQPRNQSSGMGPTTSRGGTERAPGPQQTTIGQRLVNGRTSWNSNIWGSSGLGVSVRDTTMDKTHARGQMSHGSNRGSLMEEKSGSGSLLSTSESEGWVGRDNFPWAARRDQLHSTGQSLGNGAAGVLNEPTNIQPNSFFSIPREQQNVHLANDSPLSQHHALQSNSLASGGAVSSPVNGRNNNSFRREDSNHRQLNATAFMNNIDHTPQTNTALRMSERNNNMADNNNTNLDFRAFQPTGTDNGNFRPTRAPEYSHLPHQSVSSMPDRPVHSTQRSFQSDPSENHAQMVSQGELPADFYRLQLYDDGYNVYSQQSSEQRPPYYSHLSQDSLERVKISEAPRDGTAAGVRSFTPDATFPDAGRRFHGRSQQPSRMSGSPVSNEYSRNPNDAFYSPGGGVPAPASRVVRFNNPLLDRQTELADGSLQQEQQQEMFRNSVNPLQPRPNYNQGINFAAYPSAGMNALPNLYPMAPVAGLGPTMHRPSQRGQDSSNAYRSPLLDEFRANNKGNRRYELKDIYNHIVEFSGDQHGSRFIQHKLETANSDEKEQVFQEIRPNAIQLMMDVFGNYVVQKLFEHGNQTQKKALAQQMMGHIFTLSTQMYGCRVVQKALEYVLTDQQAAMVKELENHVMQCVKDQNGNHVIQKAIERVPMEYVQFVVDDFRGQVNRLASHPYGCRVIQRMLEHCHEEDRLAILTELHAYTPNLILDQFGNYVIQHVIENGDEADRSRIISIVMSQFLVFSKHKFASNVVEKSIEYSSQAQRTEMMQMLLTPNERGESPLLGLMRDQYGNYVIQKVLGQTQGTDRGALVAHIEPLLSQLKKLSYGKQIAAIERLILQPPCANSSRSSSARNSDPNSTGVRSINDSEGVSSGDEATGSAAVSPSADMQSSDSSSLPSTNTSVVEYAMDNQKPPAPDTPLSCSNSGAKSSEMRAGLTAGVRN